MTLLIYWMCIGNRRAANVVSESAQLLQRISQGMLAKLCSAGNALADDKGASFARHAKTRNMKMNQLPAADIPSRTLAGCVSPNA